MTLAITHTFVSAIADDAAATTAGEVLPSHWNAGHTLAGFGTGVATALTVNVGSAGAPVLFNGALGTPSSGNLANCTGYPVSAVTSIATTSPLSGGTITGTGTLSLLVNVDFGFTSKQTITPAANTNALAVTGYSLTGSNASSLLDLAGTWNTSGTPALIKGVVTATAFGNGSAYIDLQDATTSCFRVIRADAANNTQLRIATGTGAQQTLTFESRNASSGQSGIFAAGSWYLGTTSQTLLLNGSTTSLITFSDAILGRAAAATWQQGAANAASPVAQTLQAQGSRSGTDSNVAGASYTIQSGTGTGTGTPSTLILKSPVAVGSGTGAQTQTTGLTLNVGTAVLTSYTVANLPAAGTAGAGATAFVTDASTTLILGLGGTVAGGGANKVPVYSDGTNWIYG